MKALIFYESKNEGIVVLADGGVATFHHNEEHMISEYYQNRIDKPMHFYKEECIGGVYESLAEGKMYTTEWEEDQEITEDMVDEAIHWLCFSSDHIEKIKHEGAIDWGIVETFLLENGAYLV